MEKKKIKIENRRKIKKERKKERKKGKNIKLILNFFNLFLYLVKMTLTN